VTAGFGLVHFNRSHSARWCNTDADSQSARDSKAFLNGKLAEKVDFPEPTI
jgi:hypothetical protein